MSYPTAGSFSLHPSEGMQSHQSQGTWFKLASGYLQALLATTMVVNTKKENRFQALLATTMVVNTKKENPFKR